MGLRNAKNLSDDTASTLWWMSNRFWSSRWRWVYKTSIEIKSPQLSRMDFRHAAIFVLSKQQLYGGSFTFSHEGWL